MKHVLDEALTLKLIADQTNTIKHLSLWIVITLFAPHKKWHLSSHFQRNKTPINEITMGLVTFYVFFEEVNDIFRNRDWNPRYVFRENQNPPNVWNFLNIHFPYIFKGKWNLKYSCPKIIFNSNNNAMDAHFFPLIFLKFQTY